MKPAPDSLSERENANRRFVLRGGAVLLVLLIGFAIHAAGTPGQARAERQDQGRVQDLRAMAYCVQEYYRRNNKLPQDMAELKTMVENDLTGYCSGGRSFADPETREPYLYSPKGPMQYDLCAVFATNSDRMLELPNTNFSLSMPYVRYRKGPQCFHQTVQAQPEND